MKKPFGKSIDDVVVISTYNRPHILYGQVTSFLENMLLFCSGHRSRKRLCNSKMPENMYKLRNILFCIVDDSSLIYESKYKSEIKRICKWVKNKNLKNFVKVDYWNKKKQINLIESLTQKSRLNKDEVVGMFSDVDGKKFGGIRGICNITRVIGINTAKVSKSNPTIHFLDSDIYPFVMWKDRDKIKLSHLYYFFGHKAWLLENKNIKIAAAYYTVDSPSPIIDLYEALWFMEMYFEAFKKCKNVDDTYEWLRFASKYIWIGKELIYDNVSNNKLIGEPLILSTGTFRSQLDKIEPLIELLLKGNNRFVFNTANFSKLSKWHGKRDNFANGCISMKMAEAIKLKPFPLFGNQELILYPYEYATTNDLFWGDFDVSHVKELTGRSFLMNDLEYKDNKYRPKQDFRQLAEISYYLEKEKHINFSAGIKISRRRFKDDTLKFAIYGNSITKKIQNSARHIVDICKVVKSSDPKKIERIGNSIKNILKKIPSIRQQYDFSKVDGISAENLESINSWFNMFPNWEILINVIAQ